MRQVRLMTRDAGFVTTVETPPFNPPPDVIVWGCRMFSRCSDDEYREVFAYYVPIFTGPQTFPNERIMMK